MEALFYVALIAVHFVNAILIDDNDTSSLHNLSDFRDADVGARDRIDVQLIVHNVSDWGIDFHAGTFPANTMPHSCQGN